MKYTMETVDGGVLETLELDNGKTYERMSYGDSGYLKIKKDFNEILEEDEEHEYSEDALEMVYETFDEGSIAMDFLRLGNTLSEELE